MGGRHLSHLLERAELLEAIQRHVEEAREGRGSLLLIAGEAGAGKTSLVDAAARDLSESAVVLKGACDALSTPRPYSPLMDFAFAPDSGLQELASGLDPQDMFSIVLDHLRSRLRPVFMIIEDVHWADEGTLDFLRFIGRRVEPTNATIVCTFRDDELHTEHPLRLVLGQLASLQTTHRLGVPALSREAVEQLAVGHDLDVEDLFEVSGGNAFYVTEVLAAGERIPTSVQDAVLARVAELGPASRQALEAVSIAPRSLEIEYARSLSGADARHLEEAASTGVLADDGHAYRFRHELARGAVEQSIGSVRRADLHTRLVELLVAAPKPDLARIAHHAKGTGSERMILEHVPAAAEDAGRSGSHREAVSLYEAVIGVSASMEPGELAATKVALARELSFLGKDEAALGHLQVAESYYDATGETNLLAETLLQKAGAQWAATRTAAARVTVSQAIALLEPLGPGETLARAHYLAAHFWMLARRYRLGIDEAERALDVAEELQSGELEAAARQRIGWLELVTGDAEEGIRIIRQLMDEARSVPTVVRARMLAGSSPGSTMLWGNLGSACGEVRRYDIALPTLREGIERALEIDEDASVAYQRAWQARIAFEQGRYSDAIEIAATVEATAPNRVGTAIVTGRGALGRTRIRLGREDGRQLLERTLEIGEHHEVQHVWSLWCGIAEHAWLWGKSRTIPGLLDAVYERALETDSAWARGELGYWMWMGDGIGGPPPGAAEPFALQMSGNWKAAADAWREIGCPYETALSLAAGDAEAKYEALAIFDDLGCRPAGALLRTRMKEQGLESIPRGPIRQTQANPANLTPRQLEVAELLASGLTNAEIADQLYVSKKTVEHHVSAVFTKLGVASRADAVSKVRILLTEK